MNGRWTELNVALALVLAVAMPGPADTKYVDQNAAPNGDGSKALPFRTIGTALTLPTCDVIVVYPGTYQENLNVTRAVQIVGYYGPHLTRIDGSTGSDVVSAPSATFLIEGFTLSSGEDGISVPASSYSRVTIRNCILCGNVACGLRVGAYSGDFPTVNLLNSICVRNGRSGVLVHLYNVYYPTVKIYNCVIVHNGRYGIETDSTSAGYGTVTLDYNNVWSNGVNGVDNYSSVFDPAGTKISRGTHSFSLDPVFVGGSAATCNEDFRLAPGSPCRDAGLSGLASIDPDGTPNDLGAFGGAAAARFFTLPNDGPVVLNVTIDQGLVPKGQPFTLRARGSARTGDR